MIVYSLTMKGCLCDFLVLFLACSAGLSLAVVLSCVPMYDLTPALNRVGVLSSLGVFVAWV